MRVGQIRSTIDDNNLQYDSYQNYDIIIRRIQRNMMQCNAAQYNTCIEIVLYFDRPNIIRKRRFYDKLVMRLGSTYTSSREIDSVDFDTA
jgi:hypothetical protein